MDRFINALKATAGTMDRMGGQARFGIVTSFDPARYLARVSIQPEAVLSGWLPVLSPWLGNGWGLAAPLAPGTQVLVLAQEGHAEHGVIVGAAYSAQAMPPNVPAGECWVVHASGSFLKLHNDGSVEISAPTVRIDGDLVVSGNVSDVNGAHGTLAALRADYDQHHHTVNGAVSSPPDLQL